MTEEVIVDSSTEAGDACTDCQKHQEAEKENNEIGMAFLLALTPVLALTFFGQAGLL